MANSLNLGLIDDPCLIFGGPYSNLQATQALFTAAKKHGIEAERIICTGDTVAYCAEPQATVDLIRDNDIHVIKGNCEQSLAENLHDCGCGYEAGSACDLLSVKWYEFASTTLDQHTKNWMSELADSIIFEMAGRSLKVVHGSVTSINQFIFPATDENIKHQELDHSRAQGLICGHSGIPFSQILDTRLWHNAGVIGMPANDGTVRTWYSLLTPENGQITVSHHPLDYDYKTAAAEMRRNKLPLDYAQTLEDGFWPTDEIMPANDRHSRGVAIKSRTFVWNND